MEEREVRGQGSRRVFGREDILDRQRQHGLRGGGTGRGLQAGRGRLAVELLAWASVMAIQLRRLRSWGTKSPDLRQTFVLRVALGQIATLLISIRAKAAWSAPHTGPSWAQRRCSSSTTKNEGVRAQGPLPGTDGGVDRGERRPGGEFGRDPGQGPDGAPGTGPVEEPSSETRGRTFCKVCID
jgi:hypothetical protein